MERQLVDYELIVMEKGTLYIEDDQGQYEVREGEYLLMGPTSRQRGWKSSKCKFYWMHFWPEKEQELDRIASKQGMLKNVERVFVLMKQLQDSDLRYMDKALNAALAYAVLMELANQAEAYDIEIPASAFKTKVDEYLVEHLSEPISVEVIAKYFGYHSKYFSTMFKKNIGCSVKQYVDERKMERAKYLLLNTDGLIWEIAEHLGFGNVQNFYHVFKKENGCTPSEYRDIYSKKHENNI